MTDISNLHRPMWISSAREGAASQPRSEKSEEAGRLSADLTWRSAEEDLRRRDADRTQDYRKGVLLELRTSGALFAAAIPLLQEWKESTNKHGTEASMETLQAMLDRTDIALSFDSHFDFYAQIVENLKQLKEGWLDPFGKILSDYVGFFDRLTQAMSGLSGAITGTDKDGNLIVDYSSVRQKLQQLIGGAAPFSNVPLGTPLDTDLEAKQFLKELGDPPGLIITRKDGKFQIELDKGFITSIINVFPAGKKTMSPAAHAALDAAKNAQMERLMHINRVIPDRYQRQVQSWETLVKILTGTIQSTSEADSNIARNWV